MAASNYVLHKVELAAQAYLQAQAPIADIAQNKIHVGMQSAKRTLQPACIVCYCVNAQPDPLTTGSGGPTSWAADLVVEVMSDADKDADETLHHARCEALVNLFHTTTIAADLSARLVDFTAQNVIPTGQGFRIEGRNQFVSRLDWRVDCGGWDIS